MPADAQVMMSTPNFYRLEIAYSEIPHDNGVYHITDRPRLGHQLNPDYVKGGTGSPIADS